MKEGQALQGSPYVEQIRKICKFSSNSFPIHFRVRGTQRKSFQGADIDRDV